MASEVKWIKITTGMFEDEKVRLIEKLPDGDTILVIWLKLLTLAGKVNAGGYILLTENIPYTDEMLSNLFNRPLATVQLALTAFERYGMLHLDGESMVLTNWEKHQNIEGLDKIREQTRLRVGKHRQRQLVIGNSTVDSTNSINNIDKDIEYKNKRNAVTVTLQCVTEQDVVLPEWIDIKIWNDFIDFRKKIKAPPTVRAKELMVITLTKLREQGDEPSEVMEKSIQNGWRGLFPLKKDGNSGTNQQGPRKLPTAYTDPDNL